MSVARLKTATHGLLLFTLLLNTMMLGCGGVQFDLVAAQGQVLIDGKPARGILVQAMPDVLKGTAGPTSQAVTDENGRFQLKTLDGKTGAVVGWHIIILADTEEDQPAQGEVSTRPIRLASSYTTAKGGISMEITGDKEIMIQVASPR